MEFSNSVNKLGLVEDIDFLCGSNSSSYPLVDKVRNINQEYHNVTRLIWESADDWQYDDTNKGDLPKVLTTLTAETAQYAVPSTAQRIQRVEVKDAQGNWNKLKPINYSDIGVALPEFMEDSGKPIYYDLVGNYIVLYPTPAATGVTTTSGMAVYVDRDVTLFTTASTTATPGFAPQFHRILSLQGALDFEQTAERRNLLLAEKQDLIAGLKKFYGNRSVESRTEINPAGRRHQRQYE